MIIASALISSIANGQNYTIARFDNTWCEGAYPTSWATGTFSITETDISGNNGLMKNQASKTFRIALSAGFEFDTSSAYVGESVTANGTEITINSWTYSLVNEIQVNLTSCNCQLEYNTLTFDGFRIRATAAGTGTIYRSSGNFKVDNSATTPPYNRVVGQFNSRCTFQLCFQHG